MEKVEEAEQLVSVDILSIGLLYLIDFISIFVVLFCIYNVFIHFHDDKKFRVSIEDRRKSAVFASIAFVLLLVGASYGWHVLAETGRLKLALLAILGAIFVLSTLYFRFLRDVMPEPARYALILWVSAVIVIVFFIQSIEFAREHFGLKLKANGTVGSDVILQIFNTFGQIAGIVIAAAMVMVTNRGNAQQARNSAKQQIYQNLELASIELFRFEGQQPDLVRALHFPEAVAPDKAKDKVQIYLMRQYICQTLNLFEMATRFRLEGVMDPSIFGSWVVWIWDLGSNKVFAAHWHGERGTGVTPDENEEPIKLNYVGELHDAIESAIRIARDTRSEKEKMRNFFKEIALQIEPKAHGGAGCPEILAYLERMNDAEGDTPQASARHLASG